MRRWVLDSRGQGSDQAKERLDLRMACVMEVGWYQVDWKPAEESVTNKTRNIPPN
jgi:hypothetical protein